MKTILIDKEINILEEMLMEREAEVKLDIEDAVEVEADQAIINAYNDELSSVRRILAIVQHAQEGDHNLHVVTVDDMGFIQGKAG